jgi:D-glycero-alpha-D-manno-heptose-7-phosphate kinase
MCTDQSVAQQALELERNFNPLTGSQDPFGCALGGLKKMEFHSNGRVISKKYEDTLFDNYDCYLIYTGVTRSSTDILSTLNLEKAKESLPLVKEMGNALARENYHRFFEIIREGWTIKKQTSKSILNNKDLLDLDEVLRNSPEVEAYKLCGAGGGGYFLVFVETQRPCHNMIDKIQDFENRSFKVQPSSQGVQTANIGGSAVFM